MPIEIYQESFNLQEADLVHCHAITRSDSSGPIDWKDHNRNLYQGIVSEKTHRGYLNRIELLVTIKSLEIIDEQSEVLLLTTSHYLIDNVTNNLKKWRLAHWRNPDESFIPYYDLWMRLSNLLYKHQVTWQKVERSQESIELYGKYQKDVLAHENVKIRTDQEKIDREIDNAEY